MAMTILMIVLMNMKNDGIKTMIMIVIMVMIMIKNINNDNKT